MEWLRTENGNAAENFIVPLSLQTVSLLRGAVRDFREGPTPVPRLRWGPRDEREHADALHALGYKGIHCAHGFRASASTILNRQRTKEGRRRFETALVEIQQDRLDASTRAIYDRDDLMRIALMQFW